MNSRVKDDFELYGPTVSPFYLTGRDGTGQTMMTTASEADDQQPHPIFEWIFNGDLASLQTFLSTEPISTVHRVLKTFHRGQTPLTLSLTLCQTDITHLLLSTGQASPWLRNSSGWSPFQEATSVGSREAMAAVIKSHRSALESYFNNSDGLGLKALRELSEMVGDFSMDLEWRLRSGVPYLTGFCPSVSLCLCVHMCFSVQNGCLKYV